MVLRWELADLAALTGKAIKGLAAQDAPSTETAYKIDIEKRIELLPTAILALAHGGGRSVVLDEDRQIQPLLERVGNRHVVPSGEGLRVHHVGVAAIGILMHRPGDADPYTPERKSVA